MEQWNLLLQIKRKGISNMPNEKKLDFKKEMERLDEIVDKISNKALPLDEALKLYEEGVKIVKDLEKQLEEARDKVEKVVDIDK